MLKNYVFGRKYLWILVTSSKVIYDRYIIWKCKLRKTRFLRCFCLSIVLFSFVQLNTLYSAFDWPLEVLLVALFGMRYRQLFLSYSWLQKLRRRIGSLQDLLLILRSIKRDKFRNCSVHCFTSRTWTRISFYDIISSKV